MKLTFLQLNSLFSSFAMLLHGGISLPEGAALLAREEESPLLTELSRALDSGDDIATAMARTGAFEDYAVTMAALGQQTGQPEQVFSSLSAYYEERQRLKDTLRSTFFYPGVILTVMLLVVGVLLIWVLPVFDRVYASLGSRLTGVAGGLLVAGRWLKALLPLLLILLLLGVGLILLLRRSPGLRQAASRRYLSRFGDRGILQKQNNARFLRGIAMGTNAGLLPEEAARAAAALLDPIPGAAARAAACLDRLEAGQSLPDGLLEQGFLSPTAARMLRLAIRSGSGQQMTEQLAEQAVLEAEQAAERLLQRIEPAMVLTGSALVGIILLSVMAPLIHILSLIG